MTNGFDPDDALEKMRDLAGSEDNANEVVKLFAQLDGHLRHGGKLPQAWRVPAHDYMVHSHPHTGSAHAGIEHDHEHRHLNADPAVSADRPWSRPDATPLEDIRAIERSDRARTSRPAGA